MCCFNSEVKLQLYTDEFRAKLGGTDCSETLMKHFRARSDRDYLTRMTGYLSTADHHGPLFLEIKKDGVFYDHGRNYR